MPQYELFAKYATKNRRNNCSRLRRTPDFEVVREERRLEQSSLLLKAKSLKRKTCKGTVRVIGCSPFVLEPQRWRLQIQPMLFQKC